MVEAPGNPWERFETTNCSDPVVASILVGMEAQLYEERRRSILEMCHSKKMDPKILKVHEFRRKLQDLKLPQELGIYTLALKDTGAYYTLPIVECVISPRYVAIGIHIPLIRKSLNDLTLKRIVTPSYAWFQQTCSLELNVVELAVKRNGPELSIVVPKCDPFRDELCLVTEVSDEHSKSDVCAKLIIRGATMEEFMKVCPLTCRDTGDEASFVTSLPDHRYLITHVTRPINVTCGAESKLIQLEENIGMIDIGLPCHCIVNDGHRKISAGYPCRSERKKPDVYMVIPASWSSLRGIKIPAYDENLPEFTELEECLDRDWNITKSNGTFILNIISLTCCLIMIVLICTFYFAWYRFQWRTPVMESQPFVHTWRNRPLPLPRFTSPAGETRSENPSSSGYITPNPRVEQHFELQPLHGSTSQKSPTTNDDTISTPHYDCPVPPYLALADLQMEPNPTNPTYVNQEPHYMTMKRQERS